MYKRQFEVCFGAVPFEGERVNIIMGPMSPSAVSMSHYMLDFVQYDSWSNGFGFLQDR